MKVRKATLDDLEVLQSIYDRDGRKHLKPLSGFPLIDWIMKGPHAVIIGETDKPACFMLVRFRGDEATIDVLSVIKNLRGKVEHKFIKNALDLIPASQLYVLVPKNASKVMETFSSLGFIVYDNIPDAFGKGKHGYRLVKDINELPDILGEEETGAKVIGSGVYKRGDEGFLKHNLKRLDYAD